MLLELELPRLLADEKEILWFNKFLYQSIILMKN